MNLPLPARVNRSMIPRIPLTLSSALMPPRGRILVFTPARVEDENADPARLKLDGQALHRHVVKDPGSGLNFQQDINDPGLCENAGEKRHRAGGASPSQNKD
jgi:hypothetical protein